MWVDMVKTGVDVLISAPQKGWSSSPCCAMVMLSERARARPSTARKARSFSCDLKKWMQIAEGYEKGQHAYHTTMPTDALVRLRDVMLETRAYGFDKVRQEQIELGAQVRALLESARLSQRGRRRLQGPGRGRRATPPIPASRAARSSWHVGLQTAVRRAPAVR